MCEIKSQPASAAYREAWERIFGEKEDKEEKARKATDSFYCLVCGPDCPWCEDCDEQGDSDG